jgi:hypothetical protein
MFFKGDFSSVSYIRINPQMKIMTEHDIEIVICRLSRFIKSSDMRETYKTVKKSEASMQYESYLVHNRINKRMHPCKDMRYSNPSSSQVLYLLGYLDT